MTASFGALTGKVAVVTGASRGIGRGIALAFAREGAFVAAVSRSHEGLDALVGEIRDSGAGAVALPCDIGERDQVVRAIDAAADAGGRLDILVNNAQGFGTAAAPAASPILRP